MSLTKAEILAAEDLPREKLSVPEWGGCGHVWIRAMTGAEGDSFGETEPSQAAVAALTICDQDGKLLFSKGEIAELAGKSALVLRRIVQAAKELNGLTKKAAGAARKN